MAEMTMDRDFTLPGVAWGGYEMYYEDKKARGMKMYNFVIKDLKGKYSS